MKTNHQWTRRDTNGHEWTRRDTKTDGPPSTTSGAKTRLQFCDLGVTRSWDDGFLGARASRPHKAWRSLGHLPHLDQPGTAPWLCFGLADAVPADRVAACLQHRTEVQRRPMGQDAGGTPALPGDAVGGVWRVTSQKADVHPLGNSRLPGKRRWGRSATPPTPCPHGAPCPRALHGFQAADPAGGCLGTSTKTHCPLCPPVSCQEEISKSAQNTPQVGRLSRKSLQMELIRSVNPGLCPTR